VLSFAFNLGAKPDWTIWKRLKARRFDDVPAEMLRFVNVTVKETVDGKKVEVLKRIDGLVNRRNAEVALWRTGEPGASPEDVPSSFTREEPTPPTPAPGPHKDPKMVGLATLAAALAPEGIKQASDGVAQITGSIQPFAEKNPIVGKAVETLSGVAAALAVLLVIILWIRAHRRARL
jgi:hypothetical protein